MGCHERRSRDQQSLDDRDGACLLNAHGGPLPFGQPDAAGPLSPRRAPKGSNCPRLATPRLHDQRMVGHFTDTNEVLESWRPQSCSLWPVSGPRVPTISSAPRSSPSSWTSLRTLQSTNVSPVWVSCTSSIAGTTPPITNGTPTRITPMRGADPSIVLVPGAGNVLLRPGQADRSGGREFYVNAINVMRGAEAVSNYSPIPDSEKFRIEYWSLEEANVRMPKPARHAGRIALVTGAASGIGRSIAEQLAAEGACVVIADLDAAKAIEVAGEIGSADCAVGVALDVSDDDSVRSAVAAAIIAFGGLDLVVNNAGLSISPLCSRRLKPIGIVSTRSWPKGVSWWPGRRHEQWSTRVSVATSCTSSRRTPSSPVPTTLPMVRQRPTRPTKFGSWRRNWGNTASGSMA